MNISLRLRKRKGILVYSIPLWYRLCMTLIAALIAAAMFTTGRAPGAAGWIVLGIATLAALYEESWLFDSGRSRILHRVGLVILARRINIDFESVAAFRVSAYVRGTVPGSADEARENAAALSGETDEGSGRRRPLYKKPFLRLLIEYADGSHCLVNSVGARDRDRLRADAASMAGYCGKPLAEG